MIGGEMNEERNERENNNEIMKISKKIYNILEEILKLKNIIKKIYFRFFLDLMVRLFSYDFFSFDFLPTTFLPTTFFPTTFLPTTFFPTTFLPTTFLPLRLFTP